jgi:hypothetical protein
MALLAAILNALFDHKKSVGERGTLSPRQRSSRSGKGLRPLHPVYLLTIMGSLMPAL